MPSCSDWPTASSAGCDAPIAYTDEDLSRLLVEVERRSNRRRQRRQRAIQTIACVALVTVAWLSSPPKANGQVPGGNHPVTGRSAAAHTGSPGAISA